ncbi:MAG: hypothetical protein R3E08_01455 [Thiotrichaceae bacterium]
MFNWQKPEQYHDRNSLETYRQWLNWRNRIVGTTQQARFTLAFQLIDAPPEKVDDWTLTFLAISKDDPSLRLSLADYWKAVKTEKNPTIQAIR